MWRLLQLQGQPMPAARLRIPFPFGNTEDSGGAAGTENNSGDGVDGEETQIFL